MEIETELKKYLKTGKPLSTENQKLLLDFLLTILSDTTFAKVECLASHHDEYLEINEKFEELGLSYLQEDWKQGDTSYTVKIQFRKLLGSLIDFSKIKFEVENKLVNIDYTKCIHLKQVDYVFTVDGIKCALYKCKKGHEICQKSMFDKPCEDFEINKE